MDDLIKRKEAERALTALGAQLTEKHHRTVAKCVCAVKDVPAVDAEPVRHEKCDFCGRGKPIKAYTYLPDCGLQYGIAIEAIYCPNCGAKMDRGTRT